MNLKNKSIDNRSNRWNRSFLVEKFDNFGSIILATGTNYEKLQGLKSKFKNIITESLS